MCVCFYLNLPKEFFLSFTISFLDEPFFVPTRFSVKSHINKKQLFFHKDLLLIRIMCLREEREKN